jgi:hypothetical protein
LSDRRVSITGAGCGLEGASGGAETTGEGAAREAATPDEGSGALVAGLGALLSLSVPLRLPNTT